MKITYPKVRIDDNEGIIKLKEEQLASLRLVGTIPERTNDLLAGKSFFLDNDFDWIIVVDDQNQLCLIPLKKAT